ncbi:MAG: insulinase family protein [Candidatus Eremiobacteraeota bacterium]|nr:insulinase family protein [Candidatus Eremiobacteraeota bacterium]
MRRKISPVIAVILLALLFITSQALAKEVKLDVKKHVLPNGLTVLIIEKHDAPLVALYRYHKVGGVNEYSGMFGASHLLEHMMFKGTKKIGTWNYEAEKPIMAKIDKLVDEIDRERAKGISDYHKMDKAKVKKLWDEVHKLQKEQRKYIRKNELDFLYEGHGARGLNASTGYDATDYYCNLPSNKLELWMFIESDRMKEPVFREFYPERDVVYEERRMRTDNNPNGLLFENFFSHFFVAIPYGQDVVGWATDIESLRRDKIEKYFRKYYSPGNTIIAIVGDVNEEKTMKLIKEYFGNIPAQPLPEPIYAKEPLQRGERRIKVKYEAAPRVVIGFHGPKPGHPDQYVLDVISSLLSSGRTSRFYKNLVRKNIAFGVSGSNWTFGYANAFVVMGSPKNPNTTQDLEKAIYAELERLKTKPVGKRELQKIHNKIDARYLKIISTNMGMAQHLAHAEAWTGSWKNFDERDKMKMVSADDIMRVAKKYFTSDNRTVTVLVKKEKKKEVKQDSEKP